ncbi:MAG: RIP metalloprotease RseP [Anaerolineae bacterium]|nr:RIP metalloprotease RseP [Anaerolineae bacterium]NUQ02474.1 RIP metalloprotease RseP [Anaerolineae bacterium]
MFEFLLGNDLLSAVIAFVLVLIPAVLIHELGHFAAAKLVGITILEFGIGMPPRMLKLFSAGGTDYTLNWLPLGGFVRPLGEDMVRQVGDEALEADRKTAIERGFKTTLSVNEAKPLARIFFLAGGALMNFLLAIVLFMIIGMMGIPQIGDGLVSVIALDSGSTLADNGLMVGDVIASVDGATFEIGRDLVDALLTGENPVALEVYRTNVETGIEETMSLTWQGGAANSDVAAHPIVVEVSSGSPAESAGLRVDDLVIAFNGSPVANVADLQTGTLEHLDKEITLTILRDDVRLDVALTPRSDPPAGEGAIGVTIAEAERSDRLGMTFQEGLQTVLKPLSLGESLQYSLERVGNVFSTIAAIPGQLLSGTADPESLRVTSPLGISQVGGFFLQESIERNQPGIILEFMALISIALGLTNLLPIPALDGGRILFVLIEVLRGRPIAPEREGMVHLVGLALLLSLMVVVLLNDIANPLTNLLR